MQRTPNRAVSIRLFFQNEIFGGNVVVAEAVLKAFDAEKMNYELLGNGDTHLHWHLFPRVSGDLESFGNNGKGPVWWYPKEKMYSPNNRPNDEELKNIKARLEKELNQLV